MVGTAGTGLGTTWQPMASSNPAWQNPSPPCSWEYSESAIYPKSAIPHPTGVTIHQYHSPIPPVLFSIPPVPSPIPLLLSPIPSVLSYILHHTSTILLSHQCHSPSHWCHSASQKCCHQPSHQCHPHPTSAADLQLHHFDVPQLPQGCHCPGVPVFGRAQPHNHPQKSRGRGRRGQPLGSRSRPFLSPQLPEPAGQDHSPQLPPQRAGCAAVPSEDHRDHRDQVLCQRPEFQVGRSLPLLHDHSSMASP